MNKSIFSEWEPIWAWLTTSKVKDCYYLDVLKEGDVDGDAQATDEVQAGVKNVLDVFTHNRTKALLHIHKHIVWA